MRRVSLSVRLILIVGGALFLLQMIALAVQVSRDDGLNLGGIRGAAAREVVTIVRLFERQAPLRQRLALELLNNDRFRLALTEVAPPPDPGGPLLRWTAETIRQRIAGEGIAAERIDVSYVPNNPLTETRGLLARLFGRHLRITVELDDGRYLVFDPGNDVDAYAFGTLVAYGAALLGALILAGAVLAILRETRPLRTLAAGLETFARSASPSEIREAGAPELRRLIRATNDMQRQIAALMRNRALILAGMSHDLRTQVTRLRLRLELLPEGEGRHKAINDLEAMQELIEQSLEFAAMAPSPDGASTDLSALLEKVATAHDSSAPGLVAWAGAEPLPVAIAELPLRRVVDNLVDNAIAYGERADLTVERQGELVVLRVADRGPGIPPEQRRQIFEPFHRLETSRNRLSGGSGLGLAIVDQIVTRHHGTVAVEDRPGGGAVFVVTLPLARSG
jgi:two-component system, OmpR family, osmolarity sensor histidine kinase EnvZ